MLQILTAKPITIQCQDHNDLMHKASKYRDLIPIRTLVELCATVQSALKIKLEGDILMVIIQSKFHKYPFMTCLVILITDRHTQAKI